MASKEKLIASAQKFLAKGQLPKAIGEYQKLIDSFPKDVRNRQKLAELLSRADRTEEALSEYEKVARNYADTGFYLKAIAVYKQMQKMEPSRAEFYGKLADLNVKQGLVGNALSEYRNLVAFYEQSGLTDEAVPILEKMLELDHDNPNFRAKITEILFASHRGDEAIVHFMHLVKTLQTKQEYAKIIKLYDRFNDFLGDDPAVRQPFASALQAGGQAEKAVQLYRKLLKDSPEDRQILAFLAEGYTLLEDHDNARLTYQHLLKITPEDLDVRERLVRSCLAAGEAGKALENLEECHADFLRTDRFSVLRELYEGVLEILPGEPRALEALADLPGSDGGIEAIASIVDAGNEAGESGLQGSDSPLADRDADTADDPAVVAGEGSPAHGAAQTGRGLVDSGAGAGTLDLDLDLDLDSEQEASPDQTPAADIFPDDHAAPSVSDLEADSGDIAADDDVELELDLTGLDELDLSGFDEDVADSDSAAAEVSGAESGGSPGKMPEQQPSDGDICPTDLGRLDETAGGDLSAPVEAAVMDSPDETEPVPSDEESSGAFAADAPAEADDSAEGQNVGLSDEDGEQKVSGAMQDGEEAEGLECLQEAEVRPANSGKAEPVEEIEAPETLEDIEEPGLPEETQSPETLADEESADTPEDADELEDLEVLEDIEELDDLEELVPLEEVAATDQAVSVEESIAAELEETSFYLQQGLFDDAERVVRAAIDQHGERTVFTARLADIDEARRADPVEDTMDFSDLMSEMNDDELLGAADFLGSDSPSPADGDGFTQKLASELETEDTESHYNLGIAYKEMGLHDDAIAEFDKASLDPGRKVDCVTLKAQCALETGHFDLAEQTLKEGLSLDGLSQEGRVTLYYELGLCYRAAGRPLESLESFQVVADHDLFFRDVGEIIKSLRGDLGLDELQDDKDRAQGNRDRISYV